MTDTMAGEGFRKRLQASIRRAGGITVLCRTTESRKRLIDLICNEVAAQPSAGAQGEEWFGVTGAADATEALAVALFSYRVPGIRMTDEDLHYYRAAAERALEAVATELDATPAQPDTGDVAALREALEGMVNAMGPRPTITVDEADRKARSVLAALSKPNAPGAA